MWCVLACVVCVCVYFGVLYYVRETGLTHIATNNGANGTSFSAYRFHEQDPVLFSQSLRMVWRNGMGLLVQNFVCYVSTKRNNTFITLTLPFLPYPSIFLFPPHPTRGHTSQQFMFVIQPTSAYQETPMHASNRYIITYPYPTSTLSLICI